MTPVCAQCREHLESEHWRLLDSFGAVKRADPSVSLTELRRAYFQAFHDRGHAKTDDCLALDDESY